MKKKLLIFDYDGVLVDTTDIAIQILNELRTEYPLPYLSSHEDLGKLFTKNFIKNLKVLGTSTEMVQKFPEKLLSRFALHSSNIKTFSHIPEFLQNVYSLFNLAIVSSNHTQVIQNVLVRLKLRNFFQEILGSDKKASKIDKIQELLKVFQAEESDTFFISDTSGDIKEGKEVGVKTIAVTWGFQTKEQIIVSHPDYIVENVTELQKIIFNV